MSTQLGSLVVSLEANVARFTADMSRASQQTEQAMGRINDAANMAKGALAALGVGVSVGAFANLVKGAIDAADNLRDMSQKTGIAVETLNGLGFAAGQAGGNLESMVAAAGKLNKSIVEAAGGNRDVSEVFAKLGISVRDASGHMKTADVIMAEVADKFQTFEDGPQKSAIALRLFGKAGADMIPLLNDGGNAMRENSDYAKKYSGATAELSAMSDNFNDSMGKLAIQQKRFGNAMATALLPILQGVANEFLAASEQSDKFALATTVIRTALEAFVVTGSEVAFTVTQIGTGIGGAAARIEALAHLDFKGFKSIGDAMERDLGNAKVKHDAFVESILHPATVTPGMAPKSPTTSPPTVGAKGDDPTKALLDGKMKAIEAAYASERDTAEFQSRYISELYNQDKVDLASYETFKKESIERGLAAAIRTYDAEIAVLEKYRAAAGKETERADATSKINEKIALKDKARSDASRALSLGLLDVQASQSSLNKTMKEWSIQQDQVASQLQFNNDMIGKTALEVEKLNNARRIELGIEEKIRLAKEKGIITEEAIARYRKDGAAKAATVNKISTQAAGKQIIMDQRTPEETERDTHAKTLAALEAYQAQELASTIEANRAIEVENARHAQVKADIQAANDQMALGQAGSAADQMYEVLKTAGMEQTALARAFFLVTKAIAVAEIIVATNSAAQKAQLEGGTFAGFSLASIITASGYARAAIVAGTAIASASAEGGYDIPAGTNPVTQLHEKEMVLPKAQAEVIRGLASSGSKAGSGPSITYSPVINIDSRTDQAQVRQMVIGAVAQGSADLVDRLQRARRI